MDRPESADGWQVSQSRATTSPARLGMEMVLHVVGSCTNHSLNVVGDRSAVNVESGAFCEYFHNAHENPCWAYLPRR